MLSVSQLTCRHGDFTAVDHIDLHVGRGELVVLLGPNGAGKTTLLRCITGEQPMADGRILFHGHALEDWPVQELARLRAVLPQSSTLNFPFTVQDVVRMGRFPHQQKRGENRHDLQVVEQALEQVETTHLRNRLYPSLSGGEKQRVHLARVLAQIWEPQDHDRLLLLDEPTAALDLSHQISILQMARHWAAEGCGVLAVLHDLNLAAQFADRVVLMQRGKVVIEGPPRETLNPDTIERVFGVRVLSVAHPESGVPCFIAHT